MKNYWFEVWVLGYDKFGMLVGLDEYLAEFASEKLARALIDGIESLDSFMTEDDIDLITSTFRNLDYCEVVLEKVSCPEYSDTTIADEVLMTKVIPVYLCEVPYSESEVNFREEADLILEFTDLISRDAETIEISKDVFDDFKKDASITIYFEDDDTERCFAYKMVSETTDIIKCELIEIIC